MLSWIFGQKSARDESKLFTFSQYARLVKHESHFNVICSVINCDDLVKVDMTEFPFKLYDCK